MKSFLRIILLTVTMATFCVSTYAQKSDRQRMTREQLAEFQAEYIAKELEMDDMTTQQFIKTFCQFPERYLGARSSSQERYFNLYGRRSRTSHKRAIRP